MRSSIALCMFLLVVGISSSAWAFDPPDTLPPPAVPQAPPATTPDDNPARFVLNGSVEYQQHFSNMIEPGLGPNRIQISFDPTTSFLPTRITIDLDSGKVTQADVTLLRLWVLNILSYHRNLDANINSNFEFIRVNLPVLARSASVSVGNGDLHVNMVITVSGSTGYQWMTDGNNGLYFQPGAEVSTTANLLNRIFAQAFGSISGTLITGSEPDYLTAAGGLQISVGLTKDNMLRLFANASVEYDGSAAADGLPTTSEYLGAGLEWGEPSPLATQPFGMEGSQ